MKYEPWQYAYAKYFANEYGTEVINWDTYIQYINFNFESNECVHFKAGWESFKANNR
jgi:hypothetical protein